MENRGFLKQSYADVISKFILQRGGGPDTNSTAAEGSKTTCLHLKIGWITIIWYVEVNKEERSAYCRFQYFLSVCVHHYINEHLPGRLLWWGGALLSTEMRNDGGSPKSNYKVGLTNQPYICLSQLNTSEEARQIFPVIFILCLLCVLLPQKCRNAACLPPPPTQ